MPPESFQNLFYRDTSSFFFAFFARFFLSRGKSDEGRNLSGREPFCSCDSIHPKKNPKNPNTMGTMTFKDVGRV